MLLWNDYEGKTIAGSYLLDKLLRPEGRSAFFTTLNGTGTPSAIRLIESLNDEQEILTRWRTVSEIRQPNLLTLKKCGEDVVDGTPLIYAVLEATDANLADVLRDRSLTAEETKQLATSLIPALQALHARNLVHEHIEPANILAAGEVIKLRSDCIRDIAPGPEADKAKARDTHDLAVLLLQARTQRKQMRDTDAALLPAPLGEVVRNGISGAWTLDKMAPVLTPPTPQLASVRGATSPVPAKTPRPGSAQATHHIPSPASATSAKKKPAVFASAFTPANVRRIIFWTAAAVALLLLVVLIARRSSHTLTTLPAVIATRPAQTGPAVVASPAAAIPKPRAAQIATPSSSRAATRTDWRVVAYTYNHASQAQSKVNAIAAKHPSFHPEVFTPNGLPPYLVTLGGAMSHDQANALCERARMSGLAGDIYVQNYSAKPR